MFDAAWRNIKMEGELGGNNPASFPYVKDTVELEKFFDNVMNLANSYIGWMTKGKMRGCVIWMIEGNEEKDTGVGLRHFGDPDMIGIISPELEYKGKRNPRIALIDSFFIKIRNAGFEPGLYIQPGKLTQINGRWYQPTTCDGANIEEEFYKDVEYSYRRWGIKLFHFDYNIYRFFGYSDWWNGGTVTSAQRVAKKILDSFPEVSFNVEHASFNWFQYGADYSEQGGTNYSYSKPASPFINMIWPDAYSRLIKTTENGKLQPISSEKITGALQNGDVFFTEYPEVDSLARVLQILGGTWKRPTDRITSPDNGAILPTTVTIKATAVAESTSMFIKRVEFLSAGIVLGADSTAPYEFTWTNALPGKHSLYARATNNLNKRACSPPVCVTVGSTAINRDFQFNNPSLKNNSGPMSVSIYSLNGRLVRKIDFKDPAHFVSAKAIKGLSSGIYVLKAKHANGTIVKRKIEAVW